MPQCPTADEIWYQLAPLYALLQRIFEALRDRQPLEFVLSRIVVGRCVGDIVEIVSEIGQESYAERPSVSLAKAIHDLRGGGLTPLLGELQMFEIGKATEGIADTLFYLSRDHLKIMRNALTGLDDVKRTEDLRPRVHGTELLVEKWHGATLHSGTGKIHLEVESIQKCGIGECCMEFGAIDRILYNLINNACRHAAGGDIRLMIFPVPDPDGENLRFVLLNTVSPEHRARLEGIAMDSLFADGVSSTASGHGLAIVSDFVSRAYGLRSPVDAVRGGYAGARLIGEEFAAWFHWPRVQARQRSDVSLSRGDFPGIRDHGRGDAIR